jgi:hypothetical protein
MVAMIFVILFGFVGGLKSTLLGAGNNNNWIVLGRGALSENSSGMTGNRRTNRGAIKPISAGTLARDGAVNCPSRI